MIPDDFDHCDCCGYLVPVEEIGLICEACWAGKRADCVGCQRRRRAVAQAAPTWERPNVLIIAPRSEEEAEHAG